MANQASYVGPVFADNTDEFRLQQRQLAERKRLAQELVNQGMTGNGGAGMAGNVYMVGNQWGNLAKSLGGTLMGAMADRDQQNLQVSQNAAQQEFNEAYRNAPDDVTRQNLLIGAQGKGLRTDLHQAFLKDEQARIERGEQLAADREARAAEAEANRIERGEQQAADRVAREDLRRIPAQSVHVSVSGAGGGKGKAPSGYEWDGDNLKPIKGGPADKAGKPVNLTAAQQKAVDDSDTLLGHIDAALEAVKATPNAVGFKTVIPDMALSKIDPEGVAVRAAVGGLSAERVHQLSGAAVSPAEFARLRPYLPASGDTADAVQKKLTNLRAEVERIKASHMKGPTRATPEAAPKPQQQSDKLTPAEQAELDQLRAKHGRK